MKNPIVKKLYMQEELKHKIEQHITELRRSQTEKDFRSIASVCYDIGCLYEILGEEEKSRYYYQKIVDEWNAHPGEVPYYICVNALEALNRPEEALQIILTHPRNWDPRTLAHFYEKLRRKEEAALIYAGLSYYSYKLSEAYYHFWRPHYLQEGVDLCEKAGLSERARIYNKRAIEAWEEMKDNIGRSLHSIEEAWLYEEVGYIYEKAGKFEPALEYYKRSEARYEQAYTEDVASTKANQIDGDWDDYWGFFVEQIPDFRLIYFRSDGPEENDYRRIRYRILNLKEQVKK